MKQRTKRFVALFAAAGVLGAVATGVALAAGNLSPGTAEIRSAHDVVAGTSGPVVVRVSNPNTAPFGVGSSASVNLVVIHPGNGFTVTGGSPPAGWSYQQSQSGNAIFSGGSIPAGNFVDFTVQAQAGRGTGDVVGSWTAQSSADGGSSLVLDTSTGSGMNITDRVLNVTDAAITAPAGATDNTVTAGQSNTMVSITVQNAGSGALSVTPSLASDGGDTAGSVAPQTVNPNDGTATFALPVTFSNKLGLHLLIGVGSSGSVARATGRGLPNVTVQSPAAISYVANTLAGRTSASNTSQTFSLSLHKTGDPSVSLSAGTLKFTNQSDATKSFTANLASPPSIGAGTADGPWSFGPVTIPVLPDGPYSPAVHFVGTDANGAPVDQTAPVSEPFTIDNVAPGVTAALATPNHAGVVGHAPNQDAGQPFVAKDGDPLTLSGSVFQSGTSGALDTGATVKSCTLDVLNAAGTVTKQIDVTGACKLSNGSLTGSTSQAFGVPSGTARLNVAVRDAAGNVGSTTTGPITIDNVAPTFQGARTVDPLTITVKTSEPTLGTFSTLDWSVANNQVDAVAFNGSDSQFGDTVTLTLHANMGRNDTPTVTYSRSSIPPNRKAAFDAAGNTGATSATLTPADGIAPLLPVLQLVDGKGPWGDDGRWYTNDASPTLTIGGMYEGDKFTVAQESNGQPGYQTGTGGDVVRCTGTVPSGATTATCKLNWGGTDFARTLYVTSVDPAGNQSTGAGTTYSTSSVVLDRVAPTIASATYDSTSRKVLVTFGEGVDVGRDAAIDWQVSGTRADATPTSFAVTSVIKTSPTTRVLTIDPNDPNFATGTVSSVRYDFVGSDPNTRYSDRAGNQMASPASAASVARGTVS